MKPSKRPPPAPPDTAPPKAAPAPSPLPKQALPKQALSKQAAPKPPLPKQAPQAPQHLFGRWWLWAAAAALIVVFEAYGPALNGAFVLDDLYLPFTDPHIDQWSFLDWIKGVRPLLMFTYWLDYRTVGGSPFLYHATNVFLHFLAAVMITLVTARLLDWASPASPSPASHGGGSSIPATDRAATIGSGQRRLRAVLSVFAGGLFLLHPLQTESVAYVASRSEDLSVLLYFAAFAVFLYKPSRGTRPERPSPDTETARPTAAIERDERITLARVAAIALLLLAAVNTKEHTLTLPLLLIATSLFWRRGPIKDALKQDVLLYSILAGAGAIGGYLVWRVLRSADPAGFHVKDLTPSDYLFTQFRVIWMYIRLFFLPFGQNVDPDIPLSHNLLEHGAIVGLLALMALLAAAWFYRRRWPLAAFGVFTFLLLLAPTSSIIPIADVLAERRLYLPFIGLALVCVEFLRRLTLKQATWTAAAVLAICTALTYERNQVWAGPVELWTDAVSKSPNKVRPRFQLAFAYYASGRCLEASTNYEAASKLAMPDYRLLIDWANALACAGRDGEAVDKLREAVRFSRPAEAYVLLGAIFGKQGEMQRALEALNHAETIDAGIPEIYVNRGNVYAITGDLAAATAQYQRALAINPSSQAALEALTRVTGKR